MTNKSTSFLTAALIIFTIFAVSAFAETAPAVTVENASGETGATVEIPVAISGNTGFSSLGIEISYDASALELTGVTPASDVGATFTTAPDYTVNPYNMSWDSASDVTYNGTLATLTFKILADKNGEYPITVDFYKGRDGNYTDGEDVNYDENFNPVKLKYVNGSITVGKPGSSVPTISVGEISSDDSVSIDIALEADDYTGSIIAGLYSTNGVLKSLKVYPASETLKVSFDKGQTGAYVKIMWWEDIKSMKPVCGSQIIPLQ